MSGLTYAYVNNWTLRPVHVWMEKQTDVGMDGKDRRANMHKRKDIRTYRHKHV